MTQTTIRLSDMIPPYTYVPVRRGKDVFYRIQAGNGLVMGAMADEGAVQLIVHALNYTYSDKHETVITTRTFKTRVKDAATEPTTVAGNSERSRSSPLPVLGES